MDAFNYVNATLSLRGMGLRTARVTENASPVNERNDLAILRRRIRFEAWVDNVRPYERVGEALRLQIADMGLDDETEAMESPRRVLEASMTVERPQPATIRRALKREERTVESKRLDTPDPRPKRRKQANPKKIEQ